MRFKDSLRDPIFLAFESHLTRLSGFGSVSRIRVQIDTEVNWNPKIRIFCVAFHVWLATQKLLYRAYISDAVYEKADKHGAWRAKGTVHAATVPTELAGSILMKLFEPDVNLTFLRPRSDREDTQTPLFPAKAGSNSRS